MAENIMYGKRILNMDLTSITEREEIRLNRLKLTKYQTQRIFERITENMSYEIFKYMNGENLLEIRATNLGGFQLTSNILLRSRIQNYLQISPFTSVDNSLFRTRKYNLIFEQTGERKLGFKSIQDEGVIKLAENLKYIPYLHALDLSTIYYIHLYYRP